MNTSPNSNHKNLYLIIFCIFVVLGFISYFIYQYYYNSTASTLTNDPVFSNNATTNQNKSVKIKAEVWADNYFAFYLGDKLIKEDSVPITTERSFNSETFTFDATYPLDLNFVGKDFKENDTGLEYIGESQQQMGDGGLIAQFKNAETGELIAVTNGDWVVYVTHTAPLDTSCAKSSNPVAGVAPCTNLIMDEPTDWKLPSFDFASWEKVKTYTSTEIKPKEGYTTIKWNSNAKFIWGADIYKSNTVLMHLRIN
jgi:hypothetical protein